jgi:succinyl-CoA synthetase alpha subunit
MPILAHHSTRIICQANAGEEERFHIHQCLLYGAHIVAWVYNGQGGTEQLNLPVFDSVREAKRQTNASMSLIWTKPDIAAEAISEAIEGGVETIVCLTEEIPCHDMVAVHQLLRNHPGCRLIGPGSCGLITPGQCKIGVMPAYVFTPGPIGVISSTDTLSYEAAWHLTSNGFGQSTYIGLGAEPFAGMSIVDTLKEFERDAQTEAIAMIVHEGILGIEHVAEYLEKPFRKPLIAYVAGAAARKEPLSTPSTTEILQRCGVTIIDTVAMIGSTIESFVTRQEHV